MSKSLDKMTKGELIQLLVASQARERATDLALQQAQANLVALENRRRYETASYRAKAAKQPRPDFAALAQRYCQEHGCKSVDRATLVAYAAKTH